LADSLEFIGIEYSVLIIPGYMVPFVSFVWECFLLSYLQVCIINNFVSFSNINYPYIEFPSLIFLVINFLLYKEEISLTPRTWYCLLLGSGKGLMEDGLTMLGAGTRVREHMGEQKL
jgi:hypothetical protein